MAREQNSDRKIAILATGDEITNGDILNTNSQIIASKLTNINMSPSMQIVTSDHISEIERAIRFLLNDHDGLIITGGLGPTSDDLTRFALSRAIDQPLILHENIWQSIVDRLKNLGYHNPPESNKQQALFPAQAIIIPNNSGTAAGCMVIHAEKIIFMLPGPPNECLPMLDNFVLEQLKIKNFAETKYQHRWFLFGVSEGKIAEQLDKIAVESRCTTGYRLFYPYVEFKLHSKNIDDFKIVYAKVLEKINPYLISDGQKTASELFYKKILKSNKIIYINDQATGGLLENTLKTPENQHILRFDNTEKYDVLIQGLAEYWHTQDSNQATIVIKFSDNNETIEKTIPLRGERVKKYAVEFICQQLLLRKN